MSANVAMNYIRHFIESCQAYFRISRSYLRKNKPVQALCFGVVENMKDSLSTNKKLQMAKYRVNHYKYRLYQMEKLIEDNNPNNLNKGKSFNQLR
jgi:hypothetical protein